MAERTMTTEPPAVNIGGGGRVGSGGGHRRASLKPAPPTEETILANMLVEKLLSSKWTGLHEVVIKTRDETIQVSCTVMLNGCEKDRFVYVAVLM